MQTRRYFATAALVSALLASAAAAQAPARIGGSQQARSPDPARIERGLRPAVRILGQADTTFALLERMRHHRVPGVSIAVVDGNRVVWAKGFGVREFGGTEAVDTATLFLAGSISKPVFATGALRLVEQGRLELDGDVNGVLRTWKVPESRYTERERVTLRRLLSHTAGLTVWGFPGYAVGAPLPSVPQILDGEAPANTAAVRNDTTPGVRWLYSGGGITIAQLMATDATGESFPELMRRLVLEPAGMVHSTYENPPPPARARFAASGHERPDTPVPGRFHVYPEMAAAGLWSTPSDLARWMISLARAYGGEPGEVLSPAMARQMLTPQVRLQPPYAGPRPSFWGLGVALAGAGDSLRFSHGGRDEGFVATLAMWPERGQGLVVMTNGVSGALLSEITRAFDAEYGLATAPRIEKRLAPIDPATLRGLVGEYSVAAGRNSTTVLVSRKGDELWVRRVGDPEGQRLFPQGADSFFDLETGADWSFERPAGAPNGTAVRLVRQQQNQRVVAERVHR